MQAQAWKGEIHKDLPALKKKAESGDAAAMAEYAYHSLRCMGGLKYQPNLIFKYFQKSAAKGNHDGKVGLAHCYCFSVGTVRNMQKASDLIQEPFKKNHPVALKIMGHLYYGYEGVKDRDLEQVRAYNVKAAELGCVAAQYNLGIKWYERKGPTQDIEKAMGILRKVHDERVFPLASIQLFELLQKEGMESTEKELFQECLSLLKTYSKLNEPAALYSLGVFYYNAGDYETALGYFTQSAHLGYGSAWFELWRQAYYGDKGDGLGVLWTDSQSLGNLALNAYERGSYNNASLGYASWEITRHFKKKEYQEKFALMEELLVKRVRDRCDLHDSLARIYFRADKKLNPDLVKPEWGRNHLLAHTHHGPDATSELARHLFNRTPETNEILAKAYACAFHAREEKDWYWKQKRNWKRIQVKITPEVKKLAEELMQDGYPTEKKHRRKAEDFLIKIGHLPAR